MLGHDFYLRMYFSHVSLNIELRQKISITPNIINHLLTFTDGNGFRTLKAKKLTDTRPCLGYSGRGGTLGSTAGEEKRAGNCCQPLLGSYSLPFSSFKCSKGRILKATNYSFEKRRLVLYIFCD
jgi:hypothetical protein